MARTDPQRPPVFVLGAGGCNSLGVVRCFGRRGIPVVVLDSRRPFEHTLSRYGRFRKCPPARTGDDRLARFLVEAAGQAGCKPVLICTNDLTALYAMEVREILEPHFHYTSSPRAVASRLIDKGQFYELAAELGVDHPRTSRPSSLDEAVAAAAAIGYPCILKPALSHLFAEHFARKCFVLEDEDGLRAAWRQVEPTGQPMLVQEVIGGRRIYMWYGYYSRDSRLIASCGYEKLRQFPPDFGVGALVATRREQEMIDAADRMLRHIGYHGIVEPEFKQDPGSGRWKIIEINARTSTQNRLPATLGRDMEYLAYREAVGEPLEPLEYNDERLLWTESHKDFASAFADPGMTLRRWRASRKGRKVYAIYASDDPLPAVAKLKEAARDVLAVFVKRAFPGLYRLLRGRPAYSRDAAQTGQ